MVKEIKKIVTHDGVFHADEVVAVALLRLQGWDCPVIRTRDKQIVSEALLDPEIMVLDQGGEYNISMLNLDHHQDMNLQSAAGLVWSNFNAYILSDLAKGFFQEFINGIDKWDTNRDGCHGEWKQEFRNFSHLIAGFNRDPFDSVRQDTQFERAVQFAMAVIRNEKESALEKAKAEKEYSEHTVINGIALFPKFSPIWKEKGEYEFAVMPHPSGWQVVAAKIVNKVVPETAKDFEGFIFRHNTGFMATFDTLDSIMEFVKTFK
jgi:uncharacterized UPF0160 family protein